MLTDTFRTMRLQADGGKERFGDWASRIARGAMPFLASMYLQAAKRAGGVGADADRLVAAAEARARVVGDAVAFTTSDWIQEGRDPSSVLSVERAASVAMTEMTNAQGQAVAIVGRDGRLRWIADGKPCLACRRLHGKVVKAGRPFGKDHDGNPVYHPGLHPNCQCRVERV